MQAFAQEEREQERFRHFADAAVRAQQRSAVLGSINSLGSGLVATLGAGAILWLGARHVLDNKLTIGSLLVFLVYLTALQTQVKALAGVHTAWRGVSASLDRVGEILEAEPGPRASATVSTLTTSASSASNRAAIRLRNTESSSTTRIVSPARLILDMGFISKRISEIFR